jgi:hypothetical protein
MRISKRQIERCKKLVKVERTINKSKEGPRKRGKSLFDF